MYYNLNLIGGIKKMLDYENIIEFLCWFDKRYPIKKVTGKKPVICFCDNCFTGKNKLAEEILCWKEWKK